jgi:hypothetical protein
MHLLSERRPGLLGRVVSSHWFALADLFLVVGSGFLWIFNPEIGVLPIISIALIPWVFRILVDSLPFRGTLFDWLIVIFLVTAWVSYWAAYDRETAWSKAWVIVLAILLYYALLAQPYENLDWICTFLFCTGLGVSIYFLLTHDFTVFPRKLEIVNRIGLWITGVFPRTGWTPIHPNYVAGITTITTSFILYPIGKLAKRTNLFSSFILIVSMMGLGIALFSIFMTTSRGIIMAIASIFGIWIIWRIIGLSEIRLKRSRETVFPALVFIWLFAVVLFLYVGPANSGSAISDNYFYGTGSRGELASRSLYLLLDFPFTGGGLGAFPGLYSNYILGIPNFNVLNSHNLFLDVAIEQGWVGGFTFILMYLISIWLVSVSLAREELIRTKNLHWILLFALVVAFIHGMVDDYLYSNNGTILSLFLVALTVLITRSNNPGKSVIFEHKLLIIGIGFIILVFSFMLFSKNILSSWYANLGSVRMSQVELDGFPNNGWAGPAIFFKLDNAMSALHSSLQFNPDNRTANQRLGMISMINQEFESGSEYLETAHRVAPGHRGIIKSLGYCYVWLGDFEKAKSLLLDIPEAQEELDVYIWWWGTQGRDDLSENANLALQLLRNSTH